ncbi:unnamed protein product [Lepeophtheirus salmonis]|uniref:(salmon louse) hypothetical protein n=1 Tax=Lepeophtheirus salmonis TaxID=72036 RepID=A0A7R8HAA2_LEPSM|nr:unnamed protein product [Lepeophtheirus salmonis]CAF2961401.1 unnamed protein product [Lepeophtheirus salmonis]
MNELDPADFSSQKAGEGVIQTIDQHTLSSVIEPTFRELGLGIHGSVLPHGILQSALENCHTILGVPCFHLKRIKIFVRVVYESILKTLKEESSHMPPGSPENIRKPFELRFVVSSSTMCRNDHQDILHFQENSDTSNHMSVDDDDLENQDPSEIVKLEEDSFSHLVAPEDMLVVSKDEGVGEEIISSPHCSYEEIVHRDDEMISTTGESIDENKILFILTQWTLTLQEVYQERIENENGFKSLPGTKCVCSRTSSISKELQRLQNRLSEKRYDISINKQQISLYSTEEKELNRIQTLIKAHVSIQISRPSDETVLEARRLVREIEEPEQYLSALTRNLISIVKDLLPCGSGGIHLTCTEGEHFPQEGTSGVMEQDEEEDMSLLVASMSTSPSKSSRKRKQAVKTKSPPASPVTSSPSKKPRKVRSISFGGSDSTFESPSPFRVRPFYKTNNVIDILEKKKKMAKTNGLYQFVLWREALKAEKDRVVHTPSSGKSHNKRLSFDL